MAQQRIVVSLMSASWNGLPKPSDDHGLSQPSTMPPLIGS